MAANLTARRIQVLIGDDAQAWSTAAADFSPTYDSVGESGLITLRASLDLLDVTGLPESLNPRANPGRWREETRFRISVARANGTWQQFGDLRLLEIPRGPGREGVLSLELGCWLAWANGQQPEGDRSAVALGDATNSATVATRLLVAAGIPEAAIALGTWPYDLGYPLQREGSGGYVGQAGALAWANGHRHLYQDSGGVIRAVQWGPTPGTPVAAVVLRSNDVLFEPNPDPVQPVERVVVAGTGYEVAATPERSSASASVTEPASNINPDASGNVTLTTTEIQEWGQSDTYLWTRQTTRVTLPQALVFVGSTSTSQTQVSVVVENRYDLETLFRYQTRETETADIRALIPDGRIVRGTATELFFGPATIRQTITDYTVDPDAEALTKRVETEQRPRYSLEGEATPAGTARNLVDAAVTETEWREDRPGLWVERQSRRVAAGQSSSRGARIKPTALTAERPTARLNAPPPQADRWPDPVNLKEQQFEAVADWAHPGGSANRNRIRTLSSEPAFSNDQCFDLAVRSVQLLEGHREGHLLELELTDALLWCPPLATVTVDDGANLWTFKADGLSWEYWTDSAKAVAQGILVARVEVEEPVGTPLPEFASGLEPGQEAPPEPPPFVPGEDLVIDPGGYFYGGRFTESQSSGPETVVNVIRGGYLYGGRWRTPSSVEGDTYENADGDLYLRPDEESTYLRPE